jgi:hypothetical protein
MRSSTSHPSGQPTKSPPTTAGKNQFRRHVKVAIGILFAECILKQLNVSGDKLQPDPSEGPAREPERCWPAGARGLEALPRDSSL